ncbi:hypothetical protein PoB_002707100 [Plakobranchus ocellatus]|uniref:Uncharacterized protein n=1 Tax=Plakobranchus ocellatus TaxID=259542 RepID=A0AAV3ZNA4_9GAST|nr:hypothetical protein PoB_002707100 [Plakobranchus ocellatus]
MLSGSSSPGGSGRRLVLTLLILLSLDSDTFLPTSHGKRQHSKALDRNCQGYGCTQQEEVFLGERLLVDLDLQKGHALSNAAGVDLLAAPSLSNRLHSGQVDFSPPSSHT